MKDLTMEDKEDNNSQDKAKHPDDIDFRKEPLLYVESTISDKVEVEKEKTTLSVWNIGLLRKRETTELEDGGFGLLPIKTSYQVKRPVLQGECSKSPRSPPKYLGKKMEQLVNAKEEAEKWVHTIESRFLGDETVTKFKTDLDLMFGTTQSTSTESEAAADEENEKTNEMAIVVFEEVDNAKEFDACWECPNFIATITEKVEIEVQKSEIRKSLSNSLSSEGRIEAPGFDLGINPEKKESG
ncbi:hypothetical protein L6452_42052 [Arctium lappa]|uniref:Uncharacterized protein n=1 Tax=Arctium lappa TaxID=4217 RepID=A0ACB8XGR8_ARCLA|nr:hypothetical protein L6452_42052 [Arctium lappa]